MTTGTADPILDVRDLRLQFRSDGNVVRAVDGVSLQLQRGEVLGLVGESGCGKSVLNLAVMGLIPSPPGHVSAGRIAFDGEDLRDASAERLRSLRGRHIAMIFQDPMTSLNPYLTVERQLTEVLQVHQGMTRDAARTRAIEMLERVGIPDAGNRIDQHPHEFSGGMRQRVMIAMALLCEPELLIADEPTTALDVTIQAQILDLIRELQSRTGTSVILITHDLGVVAGMADRVAVMYAGRLVEQGAAVDVLSAPAHPYTQGLVASIPRLDARKSRDLVPIPGLPPDLSQLPTGCAFHPRCGRATELCRTEFPGVTELPRGHVVRCYHPGPAADPAQQVGQDVEQDGGSETGAS